MERITTNEKLRSINAGAKLYLCPWGDYSNSSYGKVLTHAVGCGYKHGYFGVPIALIKTAVFINGGWIISLLKK